MLFLANLIQGLLILNGLRSRHCPRALLGYHYLLVFVAQAVPAGVSWGEQNQSARVCRVLSIPAQLLSPDGVRAGRDDLVCRVGSCHRGSSQKGRFCPVLGLLRPATKLDK